MLYVFDGMKVINNFLFISILKIIWAYILTYCKLVNVYGEK